MTTTIILPKVTVKQVADPRLQDYGLLVAEGRYDEFIRDHRYDVMLEVLIDNMRSVRGKKEEELTGEELLRYRRQVGGYAYLAKALGFQVQQVTTYWQLVAAYVDLRKAYFVRLAESDRFDFYCDVVSYEEATSGETPAFYRFLASEDAAEIATGVLTYYRALLSLFYERSGDVFTTGFKSMLFAHRIKFIQRWFAVLGKKTDAAWRTGTEVAGALAGLKDASRTVANGLDHTVGMDNLVDVKKIIRSAADNRGFMTCVERFLLERYRNSEAAPEILDSANRLLMDDNDEWVEIADDFYYRDGYDRDLGDVYRDGDSDDGTGGSDSDYDEMPRLVGVGGDFDYFDSARPPSFEYVDLVVYGNDFSRKMKTITISLDPTTGPLHWSRYDEHMRIYTPAIVRRVVGYDRYYYYMEYREYDSLSEEAKRMLTVQFLAATDSDIDDADYSGLRRKLLVEPADIELFVAQYFMFDYGGPYNRLTANLMYDNPVMSGNAFETYIQAMLDLKIHGVEHLTGFAKQIFVDMVVRDVQELRADWRAVQAEEHKLERRLKFIKMLCDSIHLFTGLVDKEAPLAKFVSDLARLQRSSFCRGGWPGLVHEMQGR